jgi:hypothetical protein
LITKAQYKFIQLCTLGRIAYTWRPGGFDFQYGHYPYKNTTKITEIVVFLKSIARTHEIKLSLEAIDMLLREELATAERVGETACQVWLEDARKHWWEHEYKHGEPEPQRADYFGLTTFPPNDLAAVEVAFADEVMRVVPSAV